MKMLIWPLFLGRASTICREALRPVDTSLTARESGEDLVKGIWEPNAGHIIFAMVQINWAASCGELFTQTLNSLPAVALPLTACVTAP